MTNDPEFRKNENERIEVLRKARYAEDIEAARKKSRETSKRYREKKKLEKQNAAKKKAVGFNSPQAYGKAVKRVMMALPNSPSKAKMAIQGIAPHVGLTLQKKMSDNFKSAVTLSVDTETLIKEFYFRMDVVYTSPGENDMMTVWEGGERKRVRKYYLTMYLKEIYYMFKTFYPENDVGFSKFASLRPANVLLLKSQPRDQCKCKLHENFRLKLHALHVDYNGGNFWERFLCECGELQNEC